MANTQLSVVIVEDEKIFLDKLVRMLLADPAFRLVGRASNKRKALDEIADKKPDLVLLDLGLHNEVDAGFKIAEELGKSPYQPMVIFVTGQHTAGARAFEYPKAVHYLTKPIDWPKFYAALDRAKKSLLPNAAAAWHPLEKFKSRDDSGVARVVYAEEILFIKANDDVVDIHLADGRHIGNVLKTMVELEAELASLADGPKFFRSHTSYLVNLLRVQELKIVKSRIGKSGDDGEKKEVVCESRFVVFYGSEKTARVARQKRQELEALLGLSKKR
ncbi:MAG: LytR/AlgR family response regulator transcription factor [Candidatus Methylumidiphilus sp.]